MDEKFEAILTKMVEKSEEQQERILQQQNQITGLIDAIKAMPGVAHPIAVNVAAPVIDPLIARAEKVQKLSMNMRRSTRIKVFKASTEFDIRIYIKKFEEEINTMKQIVGIADDLTREEYVPIFRNSLDFTVIERVEQRRFLRKILQLS